MTNALRAGERIKIRLFKKHFFFRISESLYPSVSAFVTPLDSLNPLGQRHPIDKYNDPMG